MPLPHRPSPFFNTLLGHVYDLPLRTLERVAAYVALVHAATTERSFREPCLVVGSCVMKHVEPDLFVKARSGALEWQTAKDFLRLDAWSDQSAREWYEQWWRYVTDAKLSGGDEWARAIHNSLFRYNLDREGILPIICKYIEELRTIET